MTIRVPTITIINTVADLENISNNPSGIYVLGANIDASGFTFTSIANFTGTLDGAGYSISNFNSELFGTIEAQGTVTNVHLVNVNVSGSGDR